MDPRWTGCGAGCTGPRWTGPSGGAKPRSMVDCARERGERRRQGRPAGRCGVRRRHGREVGARRCSVSRHGEARQGHRRAARGAAGAKRALAAAVEGRSVRLARRRRAPPARSPEHWGAGEGTRRPLARSPCTREARGNLTFARTAAEGQFDGGRRGLGESKLERRSCDAIGGG